MTTPVVCLQEPFERNFGRSFSIPRVSKNSSPDSSPSALVCQRVRGDGFTGSWHFHRDMELFLMLSGGAQRLVGSRVSSLKKGDLTLLGSNLAHCLCDEKEHGKSAEAIQIRFDEAFLGERWTEGQDMKAIRGLFLRAARGLEIEGAVRARTAATMHRMLAAQGAQRIVLLLEILHELSVATTLFEISPKECLVGKTVPECSHLGQIVTFIQERLADPIYQNDVAQHLGMSESAFRRRFSSLTGRSFPAYVNELRVKKVSRMLVETDATITEAAYSCGFDSMANFEIQFRRIQGCSPKAYRQKIRGFLNPVLTDSGI